MYPAAIMKEFFCSETSRQLLFAAYDIQKPRKTDLFRIHHHAQLELGYIMEGEGIYLLENERYEVRKGDLMLIRTNEQHCVPTIYSPSLVSFNIHIEPYFLWNVCADFIDSRRLHTLINVNLPVKHYFPDKGEYMEQLFQLAKDPEANRFRIRKGLLELIDLLLLENPLPENTLEKDVLSNRVEDIQNAIRCI